MQQQAFVLLTMVRWSTMRAALDTTIRPQNTHNQPFLSTATAREYTLPARSHTQGGASSSIDNPNAKTHSTGHGVLKKARQAMSDNPKPRAPTALSRQRAKADGCISGPRRASDESAAST